MKTVPFLDAVLGQDPIIVIDGGARNGTFELGRLAPYIHVYGFEPNHAEYEKLLTGKTDLYMASRAGTPRYAKNTICPVALGHVDGPQTLYITKGPGACSLVPPNRSLTDQYATTYASVFEVIDTQHVECATLDTIMKQQHLSYLDYIKLDTQGNEHEILFAHPEVLDRVSVIKSEVEFVETYQQQHLFADIDTGLRKAGFQFIDMVIGPEKRIGRDMLRRQRGTYELLWADAYWARTLGDEERRRQPARALKQALTVMELGYVDYGLFLLRQLGAMYDPAWLDAIQAYYARERRTLKRYIPRPVKTALKQVYHACTGQPVTAR